MIIKTGKIKRLISFFLTSERLNSQTCVAKNIDTTKTILDHKVEE